VEDMRFKDLEMKTANLRCNKIAENGAGVGGDLNRVNVLPPLLLKVEEEGRSGSAMSAASSVSVSSAYLPKIDSRYLPK